MWVLSPRRNCSLSTLAAKKRTWMRSMITAIANTRHRAMGYMPNPPPFQWCAIVSKKEPMFVVPLRKESENYLAESGGQPSSRRPTRPDATPACVRNLGAEQPPGVNRLLAKHRLPLTRTRPGLALSSPQSLGYVPALPWLASSLSPEPGTSLCPPLNRRRRRKPRVGRRFWFPFRSLQSTRPSRLQQRRPPCPARRSLLRQRRPPAH